MKKLILVLLVSTLSLFAKEVTVSIVPQKYFVEKIAKDKITVNVMVKKGFSPATYEPKTSQMRKLSKSVAYFSIGVPFEKVWLERFESANKKMLMVDTTKGIEKIAMAKHEHHDDEAKHEEHEHEEHAKHEDHHDHDHAKHDEHEHEEHTKHEEHEDDHHDHDHGGLDPHVWLDPILVKTQANNIYKALVKIDSANASFYKANYEAFIKELDALYLEIKTIVKPIEHKAFMVFHPSWGYFAKRFDLEQIAVEVQGKEPKPSQMVELIKEAKIHGIKIVFVAPQFSQKSAKQIAKSIKGKAVVMDPLLESWREGLIQTASQIANSYK